MDSSPETVAPVGQRYPANSITDFGFLYAQLSDLQTQVGQMSSQSFIINDATGNGITPALKVGHTNSGGVGQVGIGVSLEMQTESGTTEGALDTICRLQGITTVVGAGIVDSNLAIRLSDAGTEVEAMRVCGHRVDMLQAPGGTANRGLLNLGNGGFAGGAPSFAGNAFGTAYAANLPGTFSGDLLSLQRDGLTRLNVTGDGRVGIGQPSATGPTAMLQITRPAILVPDVNRTSYLRVTGAADTFVPAGVGADDVRFDLNRTVQFDTANRAAQNAVTIVAPTYSAVGTSTITNAATVFINSAPLAGTNMTLANRWALYVNGTVRLDAANQPNVLEVNQNDVALTGGITGRIPITVNGQTRYVPYYTS